MRIFFKINMLFFVFALTLGLAFAPLAFGKSDSNWSTTFKEYEAGRFSKTILRNLQKYLDDDPKKYLDLLRAINARGAKIKLNYVLSRTFEFLIPKLSEMNLLEHEDIQVELRQLLRQMRYSTLDRQKIWKIFEDQHLWRAEDVHFLVYGIKARVENPTDLQIALAGSAAIADQLNSTQRKLLAIQIREQIKFTLTGLEILFVLGEITQPEINYLAKLVARLEADEARKKTVERPIGFDETLHLRVVEELERFSDPLLTSEIRAYSQGARWNRLDLGSSPRTADDYNSERQIIEELFSPKSDVSTRIRGRFACHFAFELVGP